MTRATYSIAVLLALLVRGSAFTFTSSATVVSRASSTRLAAVGPRTLLSKVAVAGATGRTGQLVVKELLTRFDVEVVALVRNVPKAEELFSKQVTIVPCDLTLESSIASAVTGCDAVIWCASGFSDSPNSTLLGKIANLVGMTLTPKRSIDSVGVPALAKALSITNQNNNDGLPKLVMLSSAGVTRPSWSNEKKQMLSGSADIPIVRLNPLGLLDIKRKTEETLRLSGVRYCIFRPCGLNDQWSAGLRPIFSQGDVAVGRINRQDVATILVDVLLLPEATGKTFEAFTVMGYQPAASIGATLSKFRLDTDNTPSMDVLAATYSAMQQLLPGEKQDSAALAMGQTYEQLDKNEAGSLGKRGEEKTSSIF